MKNLIKQAIEDWSKQGRTEEQIWAVENFMTGRGLKMIKELKGGKEVKIPMLYIERLKDYIERVKLAIEPQRYFAVAALLGYLEALDDIITKQNEN
jgi:hypothetical protein